MHDTIDCKWQGGDEFRKTPVTHGVATRLYRRRVIVFSHTVELLKIVTKPFHTDRLTRSHKRRIGADCI